MIRKYIKINESYDFGPMKSMYAKANAVQELVKYCAGRAVDLVDNSGDSVIFSLDLEYVFKGMQVKRLGKMTGNVSGGTKYTAYQDGENLKIDFEFIDVWDPKEPVTGGMSVVFDGEYMTRI